MAELVFKDEVYAIIGAAIEVHRVLGAGFVEAVYQEALEFELAERSVPFLPQPTVGIYYKSHQLRKAFQPDFFCHDKIIVELKSLTHLSGTEEAQLLNYLKATRYRVGLLINFGSKDILQWKRFVN